MKSSTEMICENNELISILENINSRKSKLLLKIMNSNRINADKKASISKNLIKLILSEKEERIKKNTNNNLNGN